MIRFTTKAFTVAAVSAMSVALAATSAVGVVTSNGNILLNDAKTAANATVFEGSTVQTQNAAGQVRMNNGSRVQLGAESRGKFYADRVVLEKGVARLDGSSANANGLKIQTDANGSASVMLKGSTVEVASIAGNVHVYNAYGVNVANLAAGKALDLTPQDAGASAPTTVIGVVKKVGNAYLVTDETNNVTVELRGKSLKAGDRVQVTGTPVAGATPTKPATQVLNITSSKKLGAAAAAAGAAAGAAGAGAGAAGAGAAAAGGAAAGAAGAGAAAAGAAAAGAAAAGISATTAVVAGVAAAAVVGTAAGVAANSNTTGTSTGLSPGK